MLIAAQGPSCGSPEWVLRLPPAANLDYQAASFARAAESGQVPLLHAAISPRQGIPWGALVISEIEGGAPFPGGLPAIARALAALHSVPFRRRRNGRHCRQTTIPSVPR